MNNFTKYATINGLDTATITYDNIEDDKEKAVDKDNAVDKSEEIALVMTILTVIVNIIFIKLLLKILRGRKKR